MPVISVTIPRNQAVSIQMEAEMHGISADLIDTDQDVSYIDLVGTQEKIDLVMKKFDTFVIDHNDSIPHDEPVFTFLGRDWI